MKNKNPGLGLCLAVLACSAAAETPAPTAGMVTVDIKSQPVGSALNELAQQAGMQVIFYSDVAEGIRAQAVAGTVTPDAALQRLLLSTGLTYEYVNSRTVAVQAEPTSSLALAAIVDRVRPGPAIRLASSELITQGTAQAAASQEQSAPGVKDERRTPRIEEVVVTARKRTENLLDVPISITAITADEIDQRGLTNGSDYLRGIPGVNQTEGYQGQTVTIRGIETRLQSQNFYSGTTTATYFGETPTTNSAGLNGATNVDLKLVDVERVEVLRGPQGTAFGNSSMAGAVRTIPVRPHLDQVEGKLAVGYAVTSGTGGDGYNAQAIGNLPLVKDKFAVRAVAYQYEDSGFYRNVAGSDADFQAAVVVPYGAEAFAIDAGQVGDSHVVGGRIAALLQLSDDLSFDLSYLSQRTQADDSPVAWSSDGAAYDQTMFQVAPQHVHRGKTGGVSDTDIDIANVVMSYSLGWAELLATYSHTDSGTTVAYPYTIFGSAFPSPASAYSPGNHGEHVGEVRLATKLDGAWNFLVGVYMEELKDEARFDERWYGDPATNFYAPGEEVLGVTLDRRDLKQTALFGEVSWELLPNLTLTGGARAFEYDRKFVFDGSGPFWGDLHVNKDTEDSGESFRANLSYKVSDDALVYAGWSQGFRLGQLQRGLPPGLCDRDSDGIVDGTDITIESSTHVESDSVDNYEIGGKFSLFDSRLRVDAAIFRMEWTDIPVAVRAGVLGQNCGINYTTNAGKALSEGVELQANFQITEPLRVDFGGSWINARLTEDVPAIGASKGNSLPGSPKANANLGLQYGFEVAGYRAYVRADSIYVGGFHGDLLESPNLKVRDYMKVDTSARIEIGNFTIDAFVRNLTNEDSFTFRGVNPRSGQFFGYRMRPRTSGIQIAYSF